MKLFLSALALIAFTTSSFALETTEVQEGDSSIMMSVEKADVDGEEAELNLMRSPLYYYWCRDGRLPVDGYCRDRFFGLVSDCFNVIGVGLRSNHCKRITRNRGYDVSILDGLGGTMCHCFGAVDAD